MNKFRNYFESVAKQVFLISYAAGLLFFLLYFRDIFGFIGRILYFLSPLFTGIAVAYVLNLPMVRIERMIVKRNKETSFLFRNKRMVSIFITLLLVIIVSIALSIFVLPELINSIGTLFSNAGFYLENLEKFVRDVAIRFGVNAKEWSSMSIEQFFGLFGLEYQNVVSSASEWLVGTGGGVLSNILSAGSSVFNFLMAATIGLYLLAAKEELLLQMKMISYAFLSKKHADVLKKSAQEANEIFQSFIVTRVIDIAIIWLMMYGLLSVFRFPYTLLLSTISALFTIIPVFGSLAADGISIILLLSLNPWYALGYYVIHQLVLNIDSNFIYPRFVGKTIGLPPVWILVSVLVAGYIGGPIYMLLAIPVTACVYTMTVRYIKARLQAKGLQHIEQEIDV